MYSTGFDVSRMNRDNLGRKIDWDRVSEAGEVDFCIIRMLDGSIPDVDGQYNMDGAGRISLPFAVYQPFYPNIGARLQAQLLASIVKDTHIVAAGDFEISSGLTPTVYNPLAYAYVNEYEQLTGKGMLMYSGPWFADTYLTGLLPSRNVWIANPYNLKPTMPKGVISWVLWQDAWNVSFAGIYDTTVCRDRFNGVPADAREFFGSSANPKTIEQRLSTLEDQARAHGWEI
jgi:GH25 family lysozyme M1 (1,4-beta-N-acetylmuramidase)